MAEKTQIEIEQEYQDTLKVSQSLLGDIGKLLQGNADTQEELSNATKAYNKTLESAISDIETYEDLLVGIVKLEREKNDWLSMAEDFGEEAVQQESARLDVALASLKAEEKKLGAINQVNDMASDFSESLNSGLDTFQDNIKSIPVFGGMLSSLTKGPIKMLKGAIGAAAKTFVTDFGANLRAGKTVMQSLGIAGKSAAGVIKAAFLSPLAVLGAVVAVIGAGVLAFYKIGEAAKSFRKTTGLLNSQSEYLEARITNVARQTAVLGASMEDVAAVATSFAEKFQDTQQASDEVLKSIIVLNKNFGINVDTAVAVNEQFQRMSGVSAETAQHMMMSATEAARLAGIAPSDIMEDIADNSETAYKYFNGSVGSLTNAAIQAAKLGSSIGQAADVSSQLLDFESSINAELNASAMLGTNLNFNEARRLAASKDIIGAQKAVVKEVSKLGDLTKLSVFEQEALAEAAGMPISDLIKQQQIQENLGELGENQLAAANKFIEQGMAVKDITKEQLNAEADRLAKQQEMQTSFDTMKNLISSIGTEVLLAFAPIGKLIVPVFKLLASIIKVAFIPLTFALSILGNIMDLVTALTTDGIGGFMDKVKELGPLMSGISVTVGIIGLALVSTLIPALASGLVSLGGMAIAAGGWAISMAAGAIAAIASASAATLGIGALAIAGGIAVAAAAMNQETASAEESVPSIDDGVVKDRQVVSTHPDDFLIAAKQPDSIVDSIFQTSDIGGMLMKSLPLDMMFGGLGSVVSSIGSVLGMKQEPISTTPDSSLTQESISTIPELETNQESVDGKLIAKFDEMITAFRETKDVYMDGKKVTAGVNRVVDSVGTNTYSLG